MVTVSALPLQESANGRDGTLNAVVSTFLHHFWNMDAVAIDFVGVSQLCGLDIEMICNVGVMNIQRVYVILKAYGLAVATFPAPKLREKAIYGDGIGNSVVKMGLHPWTGTNAGTVGALVDQSYRRRPRRRYIEGIR